MCRKTAVSICVVFSLGLQLASSFYLPGLAPVNYCKEGATSSQCQSKVNLYVNRLDSDESVIPYEYQHFDFCTTSDLTSPAENLGQVVFGERIRLSPYTINFLENKTCANLCTKNYKKDDKEKLDRLRKGMMKQYKHHWIVDNMPVTWCYMIEPNSQYCTMGFPMGCFTYHSSQPKGICGVYSAYSKPDTFYLFNHVDLVISYHKSDKESWGSSFIEEGGRIISVKVQPKRYVPLRCACWLATLFCCLAPGCSLGVFVMNAFMYSFMYVCFLFFKYTITPF